MKRVVTLLCFGAEPAFAATRHMILELASIFSSQATIRTVKGTMKI